MQGVAGDQMPARTEGLHPALDHMVCGWNIAGDWEAAAIGQQDDRLRAAHALFGVVEQQAGNVQRAVGDQRAAWFEQHQTVLLTGVGCRCFVLVRAAKHVGREAALAARS